jgi:hypothetical protein
MKILVHLKKDIMGSMAYEIAYNLIDDRNILFLIKKSREGLKFLPGE